MDALPSPLARDAGHSGPQGRQAKGFGPGKAGWSGWRDKVGMTIRPGPNVFVIVAHAAWGGVPAGRIPARLFRSFHYPGDRLGKYRLDAEYTWCLDHAMLMALGRHVYEMVPPDVLAAMALDPRMVVETNWTVADHFETVIGDCQVVRRYPIAHSGDIELLRLIDSYARDGVACPA